MESTSLPEAHTPAESNRSPLFVCACVACGSMLLLQLFRWPLTNLVTVFLEPLIEMAIGAFLLVVTLIALIMALRPSKPLHARRMPLAICLSTWILVLLVPFNGMYFRADFWLLRSRREQAAQAILSSPEANASNAGGRGNLVRLRPSDRLLSDGGQVVVDHRHGKTFILFFTFRGILDRFSGFVYSPDDIAPAKDEFLGDGMEVKKLTTHWYWYAS